MQFKVGDLIQGTIPVLGLKPSDFISSSAIASIETSTELVLFEGVVTKVSSDGKVDKFKLRKAIGQLDR